MTKVVLHEKLSVKENLISPQVAYDLVKGFYELFDDREMVSMVVLNRQLNPLAWEMISVGGTSMCMIDPKIVFRRALQYKTACSLIVFHNHPSNTLKISDADKKITKMLVKGGHLLEFTVKDHIILTKDDYVSLATSEPTLFE